MKLIMMRETLNKELKKVIINNNDAESLITDINNIINIMVSDICEALKSKAQNSGNIDFIDIVTAIEIVKNGGIPTKREMLELIDSYMEDGEYNTAKQLLEEVLASSKSTEL